MQASGVGSEEASILELQKLRQPETPELIKPSDRAYILIDDLGSSKVSKPEAVNELMQWIFVPEPRPNTTEKIGLLRLHPASRALITIGQLSVPPLIEALSEATSDEHADLLVDCLRGIYADEAREKLTLLQKQFSGSPRASEAIARLLAKM